MWLIIKVSDNAAYTLNLKVLKDEFIHVEHQSKSSEWFERICYRKGPCIKSKVFILILLINKFIAWKLQKRIQLTRLYFLV